MLFAGTAPNKGCMCEPRIQFSRKTSGKFKACSIKIYYESYPYTVVLPRKFFQGNIGGGV